MILTTRFESGTLRMIAFRSFEAMLRFAFRKGSGEHSWRRYNVETDSAYLLMNTNKKGELLP